MVSAVLWLFNYLSGDINFIKLKNGTHLVQPIHRHTALSTWQYAEMLHAGWVIQDIVVSTPLSTASDERFGLTDAEVQALATYMGHQGCMDEARYWYDGYRFGNIDVYNPWSVLNYLDQDCSADVYWGNTSSNSVIEELVSHADGKTLERIYALLEPHGSISAPLNLGVVFPDVGIKQDAVWSMLYLAGYLTTEDTAYPNNTRIPRRLRLPNAEIAELYRSEIVERFAKSAGGTDALSDFHEALAAGDAQTVESELGRASADR